MANLTDFLEPWPKTDTEVAIRASKGYKEWESLREVCNVFLRQGVFSGGTEGLSQPERSIVKREEAIIIEAWQRYQFLPAEMADSVLGKVQKGKVSFCQRRTEPLVRFSALPRTNLKHIRNAAEKLSFAIIPYEYINQDGIVAKYANAGQKQYAKEIRAGFKDVGELCEAVGKFEKIELYILCPIAFYDLWQEVQDDQERQKLFGGELASVAMVLGMMMPAQKNLFQMSKTNADNIEKMNETMKSNFVQIEKTLDSVWSKVSWLSEAIDSVRRTANRAVATADAALNKAKEVERQLICLLDPLIFAVPKGTNLYDDDVDVRLLMCFGADMPLDFFLKRGLVRVDGNGYYDPIVKVYK